MQGTEVATRRWRGHLELSDLQREVSCAAVDPGRFRAEARILESAGTEICDWQSTELTGEVTDRSSADLYLVAIASGSTTCATSHASWTGAPGGVQLVRGDEALRWSLTHGTRIVRLRVAKHELPLHLRDRTLFPSCPLPESALTKALSAALLQALPAASEVPAAAEHLSRGLLALAFAVLEEHAPEPERPEHDLRLRIVAHVDRHLGDQTLSPRSIADRFSVSLRWVHAAFNTPEESIARYIRRRRVDAVAATLRADRHIPRLSALAARFGFSGREQLARSFRARFGMTVSTYYGMVVDGLPLPVPLDERRSDAAA